MHQKTAKTFLALLASCSLFGQAAPSRSVVPGRYIVELTGEPVSKVMAPQFSKERRPQAEVDRRAAVRQQQSDIRPQLEGQNAKILGTVDTVLNAFTITASPEDAKQIASLPGVKRVHQVLRMKLLLTHAEALQRVPDAWAQIGGQGNAGVGIKIGMIDTGIDVTHPAFQDNLPALAGFPKTNILGDKQFASPKVIVTRAYVVNGIRSPAIDTDGHGTSTSMIAAGATITSSLGTITGVAPKAYLGEYKVFNDNGEATSDAVLLAVNDAVADGMDVLNLSLGSQPGQKLSGDPLVQAIENASAAGVIVVVAAGNEGSDPSTIAAPATAPSAISVGNANNDHNFGAHVSISGVKDYSAVVGNGPAPNTPVKGKLVDITALDPSGLACNPLPGSSLLGAIAIMLRGTCNFETKLTNAQNAGAIGGIVYTDAARPDAIPMDAGAATLPAVMISYADGTDLKAWVAANPGAPGVIDFGLSEFATNPSSMGPDSSRGPNVDLSIKPDLVAVGTNVLTADSTLVSSSGFVIATGTSLSAPMVTGAAALLKSARPGLTGQQYRSLIVNSASQFSDASGTLIPVQQGGTGRLDVLASLNNTNTVSPVSLGFGTSASTFDQTVPLKITNVGQNADNYSVTVVPQTNVSVQPSVDNTQFSIAAGQTSTVSVRLQAPMPAPGEYSGWLSIKSANTNVETRVPYWFAAPSNVPAHITILDAPLSDGAGSQEQITFRVTDSAGISIAVTPAVTITSGKGSVSTTDSLDPDFPGAYVANVVLDTVPGLNTFQLALGNLITSVTIDGQ